MSASDDDFPFTTCEFQHLAVAEAPQTLRHARHDFAEHAEVFPVQGNLFIVESRRPVKTNAVRRRFLACVSDQDAAQQVLLERHPEIDAELLHEPVGAAGMIRMQVGHDDMRGGVVAHTVGKDLLPDVPGRAGVKTGVDDDPAALVAQQPEIDVVELKGKRHPQPGDPVSHCHGLAVARPRVQLVLNILHVADSTRLSCPGAAMRRAPCPVFRALRRPPFP